MKRRFKFLSLLLAMAVSVQAAHASSQPGAVPADLVSISVYPESLSLPANGVPHNLLVSGRTSDHFEIDLTAQATVTIQNPDLAELAPLDPNGRLLVRGRQVGQTELIITVGSHQTLLPLTLIEAPPLLPPSFLHDVLPILSRTGCNAGSCHSKPQGQNGFKLSVFAYDPASDYQHITVEARGRRVFPAAPHQSLLLRKPTLDIPHEGGQRFDRDSEYYQTILEWIQAGLPYQHALEPTLKEIEIFPKQRRYLQDSQQNLLVLAKYSDGSLKDVTDLAEFHSTDKALAEVSESGRIQLKHRPGQATVIARFLGLVDISHITLPSPRALPDSLYAGLPKNNFIDDHAYAHYQKLGLQPSSTCSDAEFIRRASLDAIGTLPHPDRVLAFLEDSSPDKRNQLIEEILNNSAYADHWAVKWGDLIRPNPFRVGVKGIYMLDQWLRESFRQNKPYNQFVHELMTAQGSTHRNGPTVLFRDRRDPEERTILVSQIFLGVRLECAKCHHHPNEKWSQKDFYQMAAFFGELKRKGTGLSPPISGSPEYFYHAPGGQVKHPVSGEIMVPTPPDAAPLPMEKDSDPRQALANWMLQPENPFFSRAIVNRIWSQFFGRGLVHPVDDFRTSNPASIEPLLEALAQDFVARGYDLKQLMRTIMRSHLYQLSSLPNETNLQDTKYFSRAYRRQLPAEVLLDAVCQVTGRPESFQGLAPESRALETWNHRLNSEFLDAFGRPNSSAECPCERNPEGSVVQALHLMNSNSLQNKLAHDQGRAAHLAASSLSEQDIIQKLYMAIYSRPPLEDEIKAASQAFQVPDTTRRAAIEDLMWALLNSPEFVFNH